MLTELHSGTVNLALLASSAGAVDRMTERNTADSLRKVKLWAEIAITNSYFNAWSHQVWMEVQQLSKCLSMHKMILRLRAACHCIMA